MHKSAALSLSQPPGTPLISCSVFSVAQVGHIPRASPEIHRFPPAGPSSTFFISDLFFRVIICSLLRKSSYFAGIFHFCTCFKGIHNCLLSHFGNGCSRIAGRELQHLIRPRRRSALGLVLSRSADGFLALGVASDFLRRSGCFECPKTLDTSSSVLAVGSPGGCSVRADRRVLSF